MGIPSEQLAGLTRKQRAFVEAIERNTEGLTAVSTGICPGCEQCRDECGAKVLCEHCAQKRAICERCECESCDGCPNCYCCDECDDTGERAPTMEEFSEQWSNGEAESEAGFSWDGCDLCGSTLGGDMEVWHAVDSNGEIIHGECACVDCVLYLANGDLPGANDD